MVEMTGTLWFGVTDKMTVTYLFQQLFPYVDGAESQYHVFH